MKYEELKIVAVPKSFDIWDSVEYVQPYSEDMDPDDIIFEGVDQKVMANPFFIYRPVEINRQIRDSQKGINPF